MLSDFKNHARKHNKNVNWNFKWFVNKSVLEPNRLAPSIFFFVQFDIPTDEICIKIQLSQSSKIIIFLKIG